MQFEKGIFEGYPPYEEIKNYQFSGIEIERLNYNSKRIISGLPGEIKQQLTSLAEAYEVDEIIAVTITYDFKDRLRSYELLAEVFGLEGRI